MLKSLFSPTGKAFEGKRFVFPTRYLKILQLLRLPTSLNFISNQKKGSKKPELNTEICPKKLARHRTYGISRSSLYSSHSMHFLCWIDNSLTTCMPIALRRGKDRLRDEKRQPGSYNSDFHRAFRLRWSWNSFAKPCELSHWRNISSDTIVGERKDRKLWKYNRKCFSE